MTWMLRGVVAVSSVLTGFLHYDIWANHGYRGAPVKELFIAQAVAAAVAGGLAVIPRATAVLPAIAVSAGSLAAFALSRTVGVPTLHGSFEESGLQPSAAHVLGLSSTVVILVAEVAAIVCGGVLLRHARTSRR
jgi:hypothetical protein